ncbi:MAG TPA: hypothetical protein VFQ72_04300 [Candidatus Paceibacterota bacterium]|nr:hypothetical protein [Candidatus Paceibacterota bacterium]
MKKTTFLAAVVFVLAVALSPVRVSAVSGTDGGIGSQDPRGATFQLIPCDGVTVECDFDAFVVGINRLLKFLLYLSIPLVLGMILYTGWLYLTANGESGQLEKAKKMFIPVLLGIFWIAAAYIVVYTILDKFVSEKFRESAKDSIKILDNTKK